MANRAVVHVQLWNDTPGALLFQQNHNWSGSVVGRYPSRIEPNRDDSFTHCGTPPSSMDSYGVVIYTGAADNRAWLLAWHVPGDGTNNKVYVEAGPASKYPNGNVDWDTIKNSLQNSSNTSDYNDQNNGVKASADITASSNTATATLSATFSTIN